MIDKEFSGNLKNEVVSAVITWNGESTVIDCINSIIQSSSQDRLGSVLVIDNNSSDETVRLVDSLQHGKVMLLKLKENIGVARACNIALEYCKDNGYQWLQLMDQDCRLKDDALDILMRTALKLNDNGMNVAGVCPKVICASFPDIIHLPLIWDGCRFITVFSDRLDCLQEDCIPVDSTITSGTLYNVEALSLIGGMREEYFIDFVDHECHWRLKKNGLILFYQDKAIAYHNLGKIQKMTNDGLWIEHNPERYYYMSRNMFSWHAENWGILGGMRFLKEMIKHFKKMFRYSDVPWKSLIYSIKGVGHAILGKSGKIR